MCTGVTNAEVARAKNAFKQSISKQLDSECDLHNMCAHVSLYCNCVSCV